MDTKTIKMGECFTSDEPSEVLCNGIGSSVFIYIYDTNINIYGCAFVVFGEHDGKRAVMENQRFRYGSLAIENICENLTSMGASELKAKIVGASNIEIYGLGSSINTGNNLIKSIKSSLAKHNIEIASEDTGGTSGRCLTLDTNSHKIEVNILDGSSQII